MEYIVEYRVAMRCWNTLLEHIIRHIIGMYINEMKCLQLIPFVAQLRGRHVGALLLQETIH